MSTPSKRRRKAREWMHAERARSEHDAQERASRARRAEADDWRRRLDRIIPPSGEDGIVYPAGRIESPYVVVPLHDRYRPKTFDPWDWELMRFAKVEQVYLTARQKGHRLPNGVTIVWWDWEVR